MKPLNPIMAVLALASVGVFSPRALATDGKDPVGVAVAAENNNSINELTKVLLADTSKVKATDVGARLKEFLVQPGPGGASFVGEGVNEDAIGKLTEEWAKGQNAGTLATLYFVVGTGETVPSWVKDGGLLEKSVMPKRDAEGRLRKALERYTVKGGAQIPAKNTKTAATKFLGDAVEAAKSIFKDSRPMPVVDASANQNDNTAPRMPNVTRGAGSQFDGATQQYTMDNLYVDGAAVADVAGPKDPHSRKISMKIYTKQMPDGTTVNEIGIFDITNQADIFGQRFPIGSGDKEFILDDRTEGHKKYKLSFGIAGKDGNREITFERPGGGPALKSSIYELYNKRADQAAGMRNIINVGGEDFYVIPQGGARSALAMFPKSMIDNRGKGEDPRGLIPQLFAEVGVRGSDTRNENVPSGKLGGPHLGTVGTKDYHLEFNKELKIWEVKDGPGNLPEKPAPPADPAAPGGGTPGTPGTGGGDPNRPEMAIIDLEKLLLRDATCKKYDKDTALMADRLKGKYGMVMCNPSGKPGGDQAILLVPKAVWSDQQMAFKSIAAGANGSPAAVMVKGRIVDHYLVLQFDSQVQYLDLDKKKEGGFELVGMVSGKGDKLEAAGPPAEEGKARAGMDNMIIFLDALREYMAVPAKDSGVYAAVPKRVTEQVGAGKPFGLTGSYANGDLIVTATKGDGPGFQIWPAVVLPTAPSSGKYEKLGGPSNVFESEVSSVDAPFEPEFNIPNSYKLVLEGPAQKDIALYKVVDPNAKDKTEKYYLSFKYLGVDTANASPESAKTTKIFRQKFFLVFDADAPLPAGRTMQGLTHAKDAIVRGQLAYRFINKTDEKKGVFAVFQNAQLTGDQKEAKANCVGPIVWWGVADRDAAMKVCKNDKF